MRTLIFLMALVLAPPVVAEPLQVTVGLSHAPPYHIVQDDGVRGLYVEVFDNIAKRLGWQVVYREAPLRRVLWMMERGEADIMLGPLKTERREQYMVFVAAAYPAEPKLFFYHREKNRIDSYEDLYNKRIGVLRGSSYFREFEQDEGLIKEPVGDYESLMRMLARDYLDVVIAPEMIGRYAASRIGKNLRVSPFSVPGEPSHIALSKKSLVLDQADAIAEALQSMRDDGTFASILARYYSNVAIGVVQP